MQVDKQREKAVRALKSPRSIYPQIRKNDGPWVIIITHCEPPRFNNLDKEEGWKLHRPRWDCDAAVVTI